jgi:hypothetical protein
MMINYLVGGIPTPLKNMSSSVGIIVPNVWKNKNVPNHQPVFYFSIQFQTAHPGKTGSFSASLELPWRAVKRSKKAMT